MGEARGQQAGGRGCGWGQLNNLIWGQFGGSRRAAVAVRAACTNGQLCWGRRQTQREREREMKVDRRTTRQSETEPESERRLQQQLEIINFNQNFRHRCLSMRSIIVPTSKQSKQKLFLVSRFLFLVSCFSFQLP